MPRRKKTSQTEVALPPRVVLVDANIFFAPRLRDLLMYLHAAEIVNIHWTRKIEAEWSKNVVAKQDADPIATQACLRGMRAAVDDWEVSGYQKYESRFPKVDAKDRHVAAAAYKLSLDVWSGQAVTLLTQNLKDFPAQDFKSTAVVVYSAGAYLDALFLADPKGVEGVVATCQSKLKKPRKSRADYVEILLAHGCVEIANHMARLWRVDIAETTPKASTLKKLPGSPPSKSAKALTK